jgi:hypothetical protein
MADHEQRITLLEKKVARLIDGFTPAQDGRAVWARLEEAHVRAWQLAGGNDGNLGTFMIDRNFVVSVDDRQDLHAYLTKRANIPFSIESGDLIITTDRGRIRVRV